ncbi:DAN domain family member 5 [Gadus macrocephalus]|uniref:DAN domain family member 5 n=1 Tax=Gadus macrocephalus TaxID=80720 RepID=UPI0028CBA4AC|nr:DAN domain family member 5 [Gadus macrocephalus]
MAVFPCFVLLLLSVWAPSASTSPHHTIDSTLTTTLESSGSGPPEPPGLMLHRGVVKVVRLDSNLPFRGSGLFKRAPSAHRGGPRRPFPAFLSRGRAGPAGGPAGAPPPPPREKESPRGLEARKRQGLQMWQQAVSKERHSGKVSLALSLKEARQQTCRAIPFPQRVMVEGCEAVTVHNKLCFGQCSSLFVPTGGLEEEAGGRVRRGGCSRCSPSRTHAVRVVLRCGPRGFLERQVLVVEECRCESGREEDGAGGEGPATLHP